MKKTVKKVMTLCLATISAFGIAGCGGQTDTPNTPADIEIMFWESGYGRAYMDKIIEAFETKYPHYNVTLQCSSDSGFLASKLSLGPDYNTTDIFMTITDDAIMFNTYDGKNPCVDLSDVYTYKHEGESKTIGEKIGLETVNAITFEIEEEGVKKDVKYYTPYAGGLIGLAYNADIINGSDFVLPKTTDELIQLASDLKATGQTPFIHFTGGGYWMDIVNCWAGQYETMKVMQDRFVNPTLDKLTSKDSGLYRALKVMESLIGDTSNIYKGSNTLAFTDAQTYFLENKAVIMANGAWMENEMIGNYEPGKKNFSMMKAPVISSIIEKCPSIANDAELAAVVEAVDFGMTSLNGAAYSVTQEDFDRVKEARSYLNHNAPGHGAVIPYYSNAVEASKDFLKFYYSDEAIKIFEETTKTHHVASYSSENLTDRTNFSSWANTLYDMTDNATYYVEMTRKQSKIFTMGCSYFAGVDIIKNMSAANPDDRMSADDVFDAIQKKHNKDWKQYWANAGLPVPQN